MIEPKKKILAARKKLISHSEKRFLGIRKHFRE